MILDPILDEILEQFSYQCQIGGERWKWIIRNLSPALFNQRSQFLPHRIEDRFAITWRYLQVTTTNASVREKALCKTAQGVDLILNARRPACGVDTPLGRLTITKQMRKKTNRI